MKKIVLAVTLAAFAGTSIFVYSLFHERETLYTTVVETKEVMVDSYGPRVEALMASTTDLWEKKHRNWAEQEITAQIDAENDARLKTLRQEELSF